MPLEISQTHRIPSRAPGLAVPASTKVAAGTEGLAAVQQQRWKARLAVIGASLVEGPRISSRPSFTSASSNEAPLLQWCNVGWPAATPWPEAAT